MTYEDYRYIFIVTYARSGSTLMQSLVNALDGVQIRGENNNALYHLYRAISGIESARKLGHGGRESQPDEPWYGAGELRPVIFRKTLLDSFLKNVLRPDEGMSVLGVKEIRHTPHFMADHHFFEYMDFLLAAFPDARIIFNTRAANNVAKSGWLAKENPEATKTWVMRCDQRFQKYNEQSDQTILMHYDDYVADHSKIAELYDFLGTRFDPERVCAIFDKPLRHAKS